MLLCADIGNTTCTLGLFDDRELVRVVRLSSVPERTADEYAATLQTLFGQALEGADTVLGAVSPVVEGALYEALDHCTHTTPHRVTASHFPHIENRAERPGEVGVDRLINAFAGLRLYQAPLIIVDLGTATTWDVVDASGAYVGGAIAPGLEMSSRALFTGTARLPRVRIEMPPAALGRNTVTAMESGIYYSLVGAVRELCGRICNELGGECTVVATGGHAKLLAEECDVIAHVEPHLTLHGLRLVAEEMLGGPPIA